MSTSKDMKREYKKKKINNIITKIYNHKIYTKIKINFKHNYRIPANYKNDIVTGIISKFIFIFLFFLL